MANKYLSGLLIFIVCCSIFIGSSSEAAKLYSSNENIENFAFSKIFGLLETMTSAMTNGVSGTLHVLSVLSGDPAALGPEEIRQTQDGFENIRKSVKDIKMVHSLLTAFLLWPLALLLCCPVSCCLSCVVGCLVLIVVMLVAVVLFIVGLLLFTPSPQLGLSIDATSTVEMAVETLNDICRESIKALEKISEEGHGRFVGIALKGVEFVMARIEQVSGQLKTLLNRDGIINSSIRGRLESVDNIFNKLLIDIGRSVKYLKGDDDKSLNKTSDYFEALFFPARYREHHRHHSNRRDSDHPHFK